MADTLATLADLAKINDANVKDLGLSDLFIGSPLLNTLVTIPASNGTKHQYLKQVTAPSVGFRPVNVGLDRTPSGDQVVAIDLKYMDAVHIVDVAVADSYAKGNATAFIARGVQRNIAAEAFKFEQQLIYGGGNGFDGLAQALSALSNAQVISAGGTSAGATTSVYAIRSAEDEFAAVIGNDGAIDVKPTVTQLVADATAKTFAAYVTPVGSWMGLQVGGIKSVARLANITTQAGKGLTDALLLQLRLKAGNGKPFTHIVMNSASYGQLLASRTPVNATGSPVVDTDTVFGMKVIITDAITSTEAIVA